MTKIISITNQKGGVGKTTTSVNLASSLSYLNKKVLLVDIDYQGSASTCMGIDRGNLKYNITNVLLEEKKVSDVIVKSNSVNVDILPARSELAGLEMKLIDHKNREFILANALDEVRNQYDYILIDCPPSLGVITYNALCASDSVLIPVQCEFLALDGVTQLLNTIRVVQKKLKVNNRDLVIEGVLLTMLDTRSKFGYEIVNEVKTYFKEKVYKTIIPRNIKCSIATSYGVPVTEYSPKSKGSVSYQHLAKELLKNHEKDWD